MFLPNNIPTYGTREAVMSHWRNKDVILLRIFYVIKYDVYAH